MSSRTAAIRASSTRSLLVTTKMPRRTPSRWRMSRCSSVCGITPSSAATVNSTRSMPWAPASMLRMKRSWPGTSTTPTRSPSGRVEPGEAQVDRDAARLLLVQPIGVLTGERPDERRLAVVDVPGGTDDQWHATSSRARPAACRARTRRAGRAGSARLECARRRPGARRESGRRSPPRAVGMGDGERPTRQRHGGSAPLPASASDSTSLTSWPGPSRSASAGATARPTASISATGRVSQRSMGSTAGEVGGSAIQPQRRTERGDSELVGAHRAVQRVARQPIDRRPRRPTIRPACGPPSSLSPLNVTRSAPAATRSRTTGSRGRPNGERSISAPLPRSSSTGTPPRARSPPAPPARPTR